MKRTVPLLITFFGGVVLLVAYFIPVTQGWGEVAAIWFDILAAIAFVLGGGNLLKVHLRKVSNKDRGWGYSIITLASFLIMLWVGLVKWGAPPAPNQEFYGWTFARLPLASLPESVRFSVEGSIPGRTDGGELPAAVRRQLRELDGRVEFTGWLQPTQLAQMEAYWDTLEWKCLCERLNETARADGPLAGRIAYQANHGSLAFSGAMTGEARDALIALGGDQAWAAAVTELYDRSQRITPVAVAGLPPGVVQADLPGDVTFDTAASLLSVIGPLTSGQRAALEALSPLARPIDASARAALVERMRAAGNVAPSQEAALAKVIDGQWTARTLREMLDLAGVVEVVDRTACAMLADQKAGVKPIPTEESAGEKLVLNTVQVGLVERFARDETFRPDEFLTEIAAAGPFKSAQKAAFSAWLDSAPTVGEQKRAIAFAMMKAHGADGRSLGLTDAQASLLLEGARAQGAWERAVGGLFVAAHEIKYPWSGEYRAQGAPFWWLYEYAFKPLQATIFAMLCFYVASAAFRAFRAKNVEAILLLGTAFIILLGRTPAGVWLTSWMPDEIAGLKIDNLTVYIMQVFATAGNRAIMIGIALGIASTSLKVLLGVDRSYLGSGDD